MKSKKSRYQSDISEVKGLLMKLYKKVEENEKTLKDMQNKG